MTETVDGSSLYVPCTLLGVVCDQGMQLKHHCLVELLYIYKMSMNVPNSKDNTMNQDIGTCLAALVTVFTAFISYG